MKNVLNLPAFLLFLFSSLFVLSSFSTVPTADVRDDNPPVEKITKEDRRQQRLNKRYNRLYQRFDESTKTKQRYRLQKKIRTVERQQATNGSPLFGILGLGLGVLSFILFILSFSVFAAFVRNAANTGTINIGGVIAVYLIGLIAALAGLAISIMSLIFIKNNPDRHSMKGFGIAGIVVGSIFTFILAIALAVFLFIGQYV